MSGQTSQKQAKAGCHDDDAALTEFLSSLLDYSPTIPDELVEHYLAKSGFQSPDVRLNLSQMWQLMLCNIARQSAVVRDKRDRQQKDKRLILTMEDLSKALREYGVNIKHQEYYADSASAGLVPPSK